MFLLFLVQTNNEISAVFYFFTNMITVLLKNVPVSVFHLGPQRKSTVTELAR